MESVAEAYKWTDNQKHCAVLSALRGEPARFAFKALGPEVRNDYNALIDELLARFAEFVSKKVYRAKYRNLRQEVGQSEQELAATIKMIYGRAFPGRDRKISQEDMVSKFLEALLDDGQCTALEYPTAPETLDASLQQAIHYREAARKTNDLDDGFNRAYRTQSMDVEMNSSVGDSFSCQYDEVVWAVGRSAPMMNTQALTKMSPEQRNTNVRATEPTAPTSGTKGSDKKEEGLKFSLSDVQQLISHALAHNQSNGN